MKTKPRNPRRRHRTQPPIRPYRVLIADDHPVVRRGLRTALAGQRGVEVCCEASNGREAVELVRNGKPDLVVLDLTMPEMDGLEAARVIHEESPNTVILVLTMHFSKEMAREVLRCGARGYILKSDAETNLADAVDQIRRGQPVITGRLAATMVESFVNGDSVPPAEENPLPSEPLSRRDVEIITLLAQGKSNKALAIALSLSTRTIESHRHRIMRRMNFATFSDLVRFAVKKGLVQP